MKKVAITERGDAGLDFSWLDKINKNSEKFDFAILITKNPNERFQQALKNLSLPFIVHCTITGHGGSVLEPNVPAPDITISWYHKLVKKYGADRVILRVDPIFQTTKGFRKAKEIICLAPNDARIRFSFVDMYPHVRQRFALKGLLYEASETETKNFIDWCGSMPYKFESCAEEIGLDIGCVSKRDYDSLGIPYPNFSLFGGQRPACQCCQSKTEVLTQKKQCPHQCLYCYWHLKNKEVDYVKN